MAGETYRQLALEKARTYLGVREDPPNSNRGKHIDRWNTMAGVPLGTPWCSSFACGMFEEVGKKITYPRRASVGFLEAWAKDGGLLVTRPLRGDLITYRFDADDWPDHIGIVERVLALRWQDRLFAGWVQTIEGNTSLGDDANGGQVQRRRRWAPRCKFIRIPGSP
jgi:hypothetical protein